MTNLNLISNIFLATLFATTINSTTTAKHCFFNHVQSDTTYAASTKQLKSNSIPDSIFQLTELRHLSINGMDCDYGDRNNCWMISEIPTSIKNLKKLTSLRLTLNAIKTIPIELTELHSLTLLDLTDNSGLSNIDNLTKLTNLEYLYLFGCALRKLPDNMGDLKNLKELGLTGNLLTPQQLERLEKALPNCLIKF